MFDLLLMLAILALVMWGLLLAGVTLIDVDATWTADHYHAKLAMVLLIKLGAISLLVHLLVALRAL